MVVRGGGLRDVPRTGRLVLLHICQSVPIRAKLRVHAIYRLAGAVPQNTPSGKLPILPVQAVYAGIVRRWLPIQLKGGQPDTSATLDLTNLCVSGFIPQPAGAERSWLSRAPVAQVLLRYVLTVEYHAVPQFSLRSGWPIAPRPVSSSRRRTRRACVGWHPCRPWCVSRRRVHGPNRSRPPRTKACLPLTSRTAARRASRRLRSAAIRVQGAFRPGACRLRTAEVAVTMAATTGPVSCAGDGSSSGPCPIRAV